MPIPEEDLRLAELAAQADPAAQRALVRRLMRRVQSLSLSLLRDPEDAYDVSQGSMVRILKSAGTFRGEGSLESWADRIVFRSAMRRYSAARRQQHILAVDDGPFRARPSAEPAARIREYLERLPEPQRTALVLRQGFGHSVEEIANLTDVSQNTVKERLTRARASIRRLIRRERGGETR